MDYIQLICEIIIALGAIIAIVSFFRSNNVKKRTATTIILNQIDEIESTLDKLKIQLSKGNLRNEVLYEINRYSCDAWDANKHLLVKELNTKDYESICIFYDNAKNTLSAWNDLIILLSKAWESKEVNISQNIAQFIINGKNDIEIQGFIDKYSGMEQVFIPDVSIKSLVVNISIYKKLSGTTTYEKLRKRSYMNK